MVAVDEIEALIERLSRAEKAQLLVTIVRDLGDAFPGIVSIPGVSSGEPCVVRTRIPVWALVRARDLGLSEGGILRAYPTLMAEDLVNAWHYARAHRAETEAQIAENEAA